MSNNPLDTFLNVYVDHLLDEPEARLAPEYKIKAKAEPEGRSLDALFADANAQFQEVSDKQKSPFFEPIISDDLFTSIELTPKVDTHSDEGLEPTVATVIPPLRVPMVKRLTDEAFQTLIFEISGVKMAIPLVELGGIHPFVPLQHIIGKPDWYAGFVQLKGKQINCIDGAKWLLGDNCHASTTAYQFIIMLNDTNWGIACHNLVDTVLMVKEEVKWRDTDKKRPWVAGLVKEPMCTMLDTYELISMLDDSLTSDQQ